MGSNLVCSTTNKEKANNNKKITREKAEELAEKQKDKLQGLCEKRCTKIHSESKEIQECKLFCSLDRDLSPMEMGKRQTKRCEEGCDDKREKLSLTNYSDSDIDNIIAQCTKKCSKKCSKKK